MWKSFKKQTLLQYSLYDIVNVIATLNQYSGLCFTAVNTCSQLDICASEHGPNLIYRHDHLLTSFGLKYDQYLCECFTVCCPHWYSHLMLPHLKAPSLAPRSPVHFSTLSHIRCDCRKKGIEYKMCVFIFCTTFVQNVSDLERYRQKCRNVV